MKFTILSTIVLWFTSLTASQLATTHTTVTCVNSNYCSGAGTPTRTNAYTTKTTDSTDLTRTITQHRHQLPTPCTDITSKGSTYATPISTHIHCGPNNSNPCSTSYECGCHSSASTWTQDPETHLCWPNPEPTAPLFPPDYGGGRSQRWVARQAKETHAPKQTWTRPKTPPVAARATSQDFDGGRSQPASCHVGTDCSTSVSPPQPTRPCAPGWFGAGCPVTLSNSADVTITRVQEADETPVPASTASTTSVFRCPAGTCRPACRQGLYCNKQFGRVAFGGFGGGSSQRGVAREAEATEVAGETRSTLLMLRG